MKRQFLYGLGCLALVAVPATAADMVSHPAPQAVYNWTGCYIGPHFGSMFGKADWKVDAPTVPGAPVGQELGAHNAQGLVIGGQGGCDYEAPSSWFVGVWGDGSWATQDTFGTNVSPFGLTDRTKIDSVSSVTGHLGYAWDRIRAYAKGGVGWSSFAYSMYVPGSPNFATASETRSGWVAGFGMEYAFAPRLSASLDYGYYDFGSRTVGFTAGPPQSVKIRNTESVVKTGVNLKFW